MREGLLTVAINWFNKATPPPAASKPLPANDDPAPPPRPEPKLSPERQAAGEEAIRDGLARNVAHALFLANAGALELPA